MQKLTKSNFKEVLRHNRVHSITCDTKEQVKNLHKLFNGCSNFNMEGTTYWWILGYSTYNKGMPMHNIHINEFYFLRPKFTLKATNGN